MDISDGLALDLSRLCRAAQVTAEISVAAIPLSGAGQILAAASPGALETILTGGDDYEILAAVPPERAGAFEEASRKARVPVARIGIITAGAEPPQFKLADGSALALPDGGFEHFRV
jgi:thiamine-monophosphate kinase